MFSTGFPHSFQQSFCEKSTQITPPLRQKVRGARKLFPSLRQTEAGPGPHQSTEVAPALTTAQNIRVVQVRSRIFWGRAFFRPVRRYSSEQPRKSEIRAIYFASGSFPVFFHVDIVLDPILRILHKSACFSAPLLLSIRKNIRSHIVIDIVATSIRKSLNFSRIHEENA